ncbi:MFS transporter [Fangia hongkongensis]|uniref:MFS transporter n=1 Tax=Fangia hongkongensis TaxID=270495 RepID=UPI0012B54B69|nr:MFS transporter [Fangia hongkongensis]MBK2124077.1 MFS transporter [Fangia hongkongensis]
MSRQINFLLMVPGILMATYWGIVKVGLPILPELSQHLQASDQQIQQVFSYAFFLSGVFPIIWGPIIDYYGFRRFSLVGGALFIVLGIYLSIASSFYLFSLAFIACCVLASAFVVIARTFPVVYFFDEKANVKRALSFAMVGGYSSAWLAPLISGYIAEYAYWPLVFYIMPVMMLIALCILLRVPEPKILPEKRHLLSSIRYMGMHLKLPSFRRHVLILASFGAFGQSIVIAIPFWLISAYHLSSSIVAYLLLPMLIPGVLSPLINQFVSKLSYKVALILNVILFSSAGIIAVILPFFNDLSMWWWVVPGVIVNISTVVAYPLSGVLGYRDITSNHSSASAILSLSLYACAGVIIYICSYIELHQFYLYGILMLFAALVASICTYKEVKALDR